MLEYLSIMVSFITGGGLSTLISLHQICKVGKIDYTEKALLSSNINMMMSRIKTRR